MTYSQSLGVVRGWREEEDEETEEREGAMEAGCCHVASESCRAR